MEELASRYSRPLTSRNTAPRPDAMTTGSRLSQSRICVNGCQTNLRSSWANLFISLKLNAQNFKRRGQFGNLFRRVRRGQGHAQARRAARDGRITDGGDENILRAQIRSRFHRLVFIAEKDGDDCAGGFWIELPDALPERITPNFAFVRLHQMNSCLCGGGGGGNRRGGKNKTARARLTRKSISVREPQM